MSTDPQRLWYDLVRRLGRGPEPRTLGPEEAWAEYLAAPHLPAPPTPPGSASVTVPPATDDSGLLVEHVHCGTDAARREILGRYRPMLIAQIKACFPGLPQRGLDAEELLNAAVTRMMRKIGDFEYRGEASFRNWISTLVMAEVQNREVNRADDPSTRSSLESRNEQGHRIPGQAPPSTLLDANEKQALMNALSVTRGDKVAAARLLHMGKGAFYRKLQSHGLAEGRNDP